MAPTGAWENNAPPGPTYSSTQPNCGFGGSGSVSFRPRQAEGAQASWCAMIEVGTGSVIGTACIAASRLVPQRQYFGSSEPVHPRSEGGPGKAALAVTN